MVTVGFLAAATFMLLHACGTNGEREVKQIYDESLTVGFITKLSEFLILVKCRSSLRTVLTLCLALITNLGLLRNQILC